MVSSCLVKVVSSDIKHNFLIHYLVALGIILITPVLFGISQLDSRLSAQPLEMLIPLMGIIVMTPIILPEQNVIIRDVIVSRKTSYFFICLYRLILSICFIVLFIGGFVLFMKASECEVSIKHFLGSIASTFALGSVGFFVATTTNNIIAGYMTSVIYYISNFGLKDKLKGLFLFSMTCGSFEEKKTLFLVSFSLIMSTFLIRYLAKKYFL